MRAKKSNTPTPKEEQVKAIPVASPEKRNLLEGSYLDYLPKKKPEDTNKGYSFRTSTALMDNIIAKKESTLFSEIESLPQGATPVASSIAYQTPKGKNVDLTPRQLKIILALAQVVDAYRERKEVVEYIKSLPNSVEWGEPKKGTPVKAVIDVNKLAKHIYGAERIGTKQTDFIKKDLLALSSYRQVFRVKDSKGVTHELNTSTIRTKLYQATAETGKRLCTLAEIEVEDVFLYNLNTEGGYQLSPNTILSLWNETGVNTELFSMLLFLLMRVRGNYVKKANEISRARRKELIKSKVPVNEANKQAEELKKELLTYKESVPSLLERLSQGTYYQTKGKKKYIRKEKLSTDLQQATDALLGMGIITQFTITGSTAGEELCNFVLNDNWLQEQAERQKAILSPDERRALEAEIAEETKEP